MSSDLKAILGKVAGEDYDIDRLKIEENMVRFKSLLLKIAELKKWDLLVWVEGSAVEDLEKHEADLNMLERGNLVKGHMKYTERNAYREYQLTKKGAELAQKLQKET
jgi:hypothetical protein